MSKIKLINRKTKKEYWVTQADLDQMEESGLIKRYTIDRDAKPVVKNQFKPKELRELRGDKPAFPPRNEGGNTEEKQANA